jgi:hypothetical protein
VAVFEARQRDVANDIDTLTDLVENKPDATLQQINAALRVTAKNAKILLKFQ